MGASAPIVVSKFFTGNFFEILSGFIIFKTTSGFHFQIANIIAIKNLSGKIDHRFFFFKRSAIFLEKSGSDFYFKTGSRLKNPDRYPSTDLTLTDRIDSDQLNFSQSLRDLSVKIGS